MTYRTKGTCSKCIEYDVEDGVLRNVRFIGGCDGSLQAISNLVKGMRIEDVIDKLRGIDCDGRGTSCPDQLSKALQDSMKGK